MSIKDKVNNDMEKIKNLVNKLNYYSKEYYTFDNSLISDYDYDIMYKKLVELEKKYPENIFSYSPTKRVGDVVIDNFKKVNHLVKMDSLQDAFSYEDVSNFYNSTVKDIDDIEFVIEPKIDGLSVTLTYENGVFVKGATRGDGFIGEDVTENLKTIKTLPLQIDKKIKFLQVRGEVFMPTKVFESLVKKQEEDGIETFKNPRNAAAGSLRQKDSKVAAIRNLDIFIFNLQLIEEKIFSKHSETLDFLKEQGFKVSPSYNIVKSFEDIKKEIDKIGKNRLNYEYDIDGAVVKVNKITHRNTLGSTDKTPKWAIAFKYPPEEKTTKLIDIEINVGRTGALTPTAVLEPVFISGSKVSRAVLHNQDFINEKQIKIGDIVLIRKAGDIIPEVTKVVKHNENEKIFKIPKICPSCGEKTVREEGEAAIKCINKKCPEKIYRSIVHFASRVCMNIDGLGTKIIKTFIENNLISSIEDLYSLTYNDIIELDGFEDKLANNILTSIKKSKNNSFSNVLFSLGISNIGKKGAKLLTDKFFSIENIINSTGEEIMEIDGFGNVMAESIVNALKDKGLLKTINILKSQGLKFEQEQEIKEISNNFFTDKSFLVTGTLSNYKRKDIEDIVTKNGGKIISSVSKNTDYLICGEKAGSKLKKAESLNISILFENDFIKILEENKNEN
ncbi:MAG: NAD-dependent DNA ligase LigA [Oscillospiraceae bacterium]